MCVAEAFAPAGKTPVALTVGGTRQKLSMIATVTHQGKTRWMIIEESFDADKFSSNSWQDLVKDAGQKSVPDSGQLAGTSQQPW
jgi:hypothetical protein